VVAITPHLAFIAVCLLKGKYRIALLGIFIPPLALIGAIRLALPGSRWARRWYSPTRLERAQARAAKHAARWEPIMTSAGHTVTAKATAPDPELAATATETPPSPPGPPRGGGTSAPELIITGSSSRCGATRTW
jgi:hypothetical protein